jgi:hypothetical protein
MLFDAAAAFVQEEGTIYWLVVGFEADPTKPNLEAGWKTTNDDWNDTAVYMDDNGVWQKLEIPGDTNPNLAFVITPEPTSAALLALGGLVALVGRRRRTVS